MTWNMWSVRIGTHGIKLENEGFGSLLLDITVGKTMSISA